MAIIERCLPGCLDKLVTCADESGFKFFPTKALCVHFCNKNGLQPEPNLKLAAFRRAGQFFWSFHLNGHTGRKVK